MSVDGQILLPDRGDRCRMCGTSAALLDTPFSEEVGESKFSPAAFIQRCLHPKISSVFFDTDATKVAHLVIPQHVCNSCVDRIQDIRNFIHTIVEVQIRYQGQYLVSKKNDLIEYLSGGVTVEFKHIFNDLNSFPSGAAGECSTPSREHAQSLCEVTLSDEQVKREVPEEEDLRVSADQKRGSRINHSKDQPTLGRPKSSKRKVGRKRKCTVSKRGRKPRQSLEDAPKRSSTRCARTPQISSKINETVSAELEYDVGISTDKNSEGEDEVEPGFGVEYDVVPKNADTQDVIAMVKCGSCEKVESSFRDLEMHYQDQHGEPGTVQGICMSCGYVGTTGTRWRNHMFKKHRPESRKVPCPTCGKLYPSSHYLKRHMLIHSGSKEHKCDLCERSFYTTSELRHHKKAVHEASLGRDGKNSHICEFCGKHFAYRATLLMHMRSHTGEKPFACSFCERKFSQKGNLEEHEAIHTGNRPFVCDICGARFIRNSGLEQHRRMHTNQRPFACDLCPLTFKRRDTLNKHKRCHFDDRPYACQFCDKTFRIRKTLVVHTRIHTGERPYTCFVCGRGFYDKGNMHKHEKVHRGDPTPISGSLPSVRKPASGNRISLGLPALLPVADSGADASGFYPPQTPLPSRPIACVGLDGGSLNKDAHGQPFDRSVEIKFPASSGS